MGIPRSQAHRRAAGLWLALALAGPLGAAAAPDVAGERPSPDVRRTAAWVLDSGDAAGRPFVLIDKRRARAYVFEGNGRLRASSPVLLGYAHGDESVPGIGERPMGQIRPHERTTPAGRFLAEPGVNNKGEDIVWVDYDAAISMHRVRATNPKERRLQRLASPTAADNRISYGCINMPAAFFDAQIKPLFRNGQRQLVYVLPETRPAQSMFGAAPPKAASSADPARHASAP